MISFAFVFCINIASSQNDVEFFEEYFTLNFKNQLLSQFTGQWKTNIAYYGANQEEFVQGEMEASLLFYFRIIEMNFKLKTESALPFDMKYTIGYDGISKKFFLIILNSLTNELQIFKGTYNEKMKEFLFTGNSIDTKQKKRIPATMKLYFERENKLVIEIFNSLSGNEKLISKIVCIRKNNLN